MSNGKSIVLQFKLQQQKAQILIFLFLLSETDRRVNPFDVQINLNFPQITESLLETPQVMTGIEDDSSDFHFCWDQSLLGTQISRGENH